MIVPDFSGAAHSFVGLTLPAAFIDCLPCDNEPRQQDQLSGYMCFSRVQRIEDVVVVQPFSPALFTQGDLPGPNLLLALKRGEIAESALKKEWDKQDPKRKRVAKQ